MLLPLARPEGLIDTLIPNPQREERWFMFSAGRIVVSSDKKRLPQRPFLELERSLYMGEHKEHQLWAATGFGELPEGWIWAPLRDLHTELDEDDFALAGRAMQLLEWERTHKYCGCCGQLTASHPKERCRICNTCNHLMYPKMAPVVMALVRKNDEILLARGAHFPPKIYSVLAGYVDPGETLEQCLIREVQEETGLVVGNIRYFGSQPWPFSNSLMIAFICDWEEGDLQIDTNELEDARWFNHSNLPLLPPPLSIARQLIDTWTKKQL